MDVFASNTRAVAEAAPVQGVRLFSLATRVAPVSVTLLVPEVAQRFSAQPNLQALPVLDGRDVVGLLTRIKLSNKLFSRFGYALYERKKVSALLDGPPFVAQGDEAVSTVLARAISRPAEDLYDDIVVTAADGSYRGTVPVQRLITEQTAELAKTLAEREQAMQRARELEAVDRLKSEFLAHVTHELRAPVNALAGLADLIAHVHRNADAARLERYVGLIGRSAGQLRQLVSNVLDLAKIEAGHMSYLPELCQVSEVLEEVGETLRVLARGKPVEIVVEQTGAQVHTDPGLLRQILLNLGSNAVKFSERGEVRLRAVPKTDELRIEVHDRGIGIRSEDHVRLFKAFSQVDMATKRRHEGTGLGLVISKHLAELLGGSLDFSSELNQGSCFWVTLPLGSSKP